jgi:hypothetical protein
MVKIWQKTFMEARLGVFWQKKAGVFLSSGENRLAFRRREEL